MMSNLVIERDALMPLVSSASAYHTKRIAPSARILMMIAAILAALGLIFIYSASSVFALERHGKPHYFVLKQAGGLILALCGGLLCSAIPPRLLKQGAFLGVVLSIGATAFSLVSKYGSTMHGSTRWLMLMGISIQPVEFLKLFLIPTIATCLTGTYYDRANSLSYFTIITAITLLTLGILLAQPDFGQSVLIAITLFCMLIITYPALKHLGYLIIIGSLAILSLIAMRPYRLQRVMSFLFPWNDPQGKGFQIVQSLIALGSGGLTGVGIGNSQQKFFYLPMQCTDFIFSIIGEETGLCGAALLILLYGLFTYQGCKLAWHATRLDNLLTIAGYTCMISLQVAMNLAVTTGLVPTKGIGLPLVSYGLSSLVAHGCILGVIAALARER